MHRGEDKIIILGAGLNSFSNGGDNFRWMGVWSVFTSDDWVKGVKIKRPELIGEAILAVKPESASGLIYWDGKEYQWHQMGD